MRTLLAQLAGRALVLALLALPFAWLERRYPAVPRQRAAWSDTRVNVLYWLLAVPVADALGRLVGLVTVVLLALARGVPVDGPHLTAMLAADRAVRHLPAWAQLVLLLVVADLIGYWVHRAFHASARLWPYHAVHHSSRRLHWFSAVRNHPLAELAPKPLLVAPLVLLGFDFKVVQVWTPLLGLFGLALHANLRWDFGPLRYVIASPAFHRWHHAADAGARDKNFAGLFSAIDLAFGTFYLPRWAQPRAFGVAGPDAPPAGFFAQLAWPLRRRRAATPRHAG